MLLRRDSGASKTKFCMVVRASAEPGKRIEIVIRAQYLANMIH